MKILIVDDNIEFQYLLRRWLADSVYEFDIVSDPHTCLRRLQGNKYDLVIVDLFMPDMSGIKLFNIIKKKYKIKVLLITADEWNYDLDLLKNVEYKFRKPTTKAGFLEILNSTIIIK